MYIFIVVLVILITFRLFQKQNYSRVPKKIWTYVDSAETNIESIASWKKYTDYEIILLTKHNYMGYVTIPTEFLTNPVFKIPDLIRLYILHEMGGVWIDPNVTLLGPLDWMFPKYAEFSGIKEGEIQTYFMACNKGSPFMEKWKTEYSTIAKYPSLDKYVESKGLTCNAIQAAYNVLLVENPDSVILHKNNFMTFM
jgi:mannosyltransferase OCH1-like enzyme